MANCSYTNNIKAKSKPKVNEPEQFLLNNQVDLTYVTKKAGHTQTKETVRRTSRGIEIMRSLNNLRNNAHVPISEFFQ